MSILNTFIQYVDSKQTTHTNINIDDFVEMYNEFSPFQQPNQAPLAYTKNPQPHQPIQAESLNQSQI